MRIQLSEHFTYKKLIRFVLPSVIMMIFTSIYSVVDGLFVSNFVGKTPFAALNLIYPLLMIFSTFGFMVGTGGAAVVAKTLGEGKAEQANRYFSMLIWCAAVGGVILTLLGQALLRPIAVMMGAEGEMLRYAVLYGRIMLCSMAFFILQVTFQSFCVAAEKPKLGLGIMVGAGVANIVLDALFIVVFKWGLAGAAAASAISQVVGGVIPLVYFLRENDSLLKIVKTKFYGSILRHTCVNGSSEMMSNLAASVVGMLYNFQLLRMIGEDGVAAYGVIMYVNFIFVAIFFGYAIGISPVFSYHYGAGNEGELQNLLKKTLRLIAMAGVILVAVSMAIASPISKIFVGYDKDLFDLTVYAFRIFAVSYLICGFNIFGSAFFTALNNGVVSAIISFLRTLIFECGSVILLPIIIGANGIWGAIIIAEIMALIITTWFLVRKNKIYHYFAPRTARG